VRRILIALVLAFIPLPASAQISKQDYEACADKTIAGKDRVGYCSRMINSAGLAVQPSSVVYNIYTRRGLAYWDQGLFDQAIPDFTKAISLDQKPIVALTFRGSSYVFKGQLDPAIADETAAISIDPKMGFPYEMRAKAYEKKGDREKAIADYRTLLAISPANSEAVSGLKRLGVGPAAQSVDPPRAAQPAANPQEPPSVVNQCKAIAATLADREKRFAACKSWARLEPKNAEIYYILGVMYYDHESMNEAISAFTKALALDLNSADVYSRRGSAYISVGAFDKSIADFTKAIALKPDSAYAYSYRGRAYELRGRRDPAIADYRTALKLNPKDENSYAGLVRLGGAP
jgi:tetratricopeptide (TPR) repeat protein